MLPRLRSERIVCAGYAALAAALALAAQAVAVEVSFGGDWTALFHIGESQPVPEILKNEKVFRHTGTPGYDAQFYRILAYDPLLRRTRLEVLDAPRIRWRRILLPALAHAAAFGDARLLDAAYIAVVLGFIGAGAWWTARWAVGVGLSAAWGLGFLLLPGVMISAERLTVDGALAALTVGFAFYASRGLSPGLVAVLALAPLVRESGAVLPAAWGLCSLLRRDAKAVLAAAASALPFLGWVAYVHSRTAPDLVRMTSWIPFHGLVLRTLEIRPWIERLDRHAAAARLDDLAILGVWLGIGWSLYLVRRRSDPIAAALALLLSVPLLVSYPGVWQETHAFGRVMTPTLALLALMAMKERRWAMLAPCALIVPRAAAQWAAYLLGLSVASVR